MQANPQVAANQSLSDLTADILKALAAKLSSPQSQEQHASNIQQKYNRVNTQQRRRPAYKAPSQAQQLEAHFNRPKPRPSQSNNKNAVAGTKRSSTPFQFQQQQQQSMGAAKAKAAVMSKMTPKEIAVNKIRSNEKILILMRGCSGCGKTTLANQLVANGVVYSADDYFVKNGRYEFDPVKLTDAHARVKNWCLRAMENDRTPVIIDNTNLEAWEMIPYVSMGLKHQYFIHLLEPETPWRYNAAQLAVRNTHQIPYPKIVRMLETFDRNITAFNLIKSWKLHNNKPIRANTPNANLNQQVVNQGIKHNKIGGGGESVPSPVKIHRPRPQRNKNVSNPVAGQLASNDGDGWSSNDEEWANSPSRPISKSKSVPDMLNQLGFANRSSPFVPFHNSDKEPEKAKGPSHMNDLLDLNFSLPPPEMAPPKAAANSSLNGGVGKLGISNLNLLTNWEIPAYPGSTITAEEKPPKVENEEKVVSDKVEVVGAATDVEKTESESVEDPIKVLKSFFSNVPDDSLSDIYERCKGDLQWVVNVLLDAGYEMKMPGSDDEAGAQPPSENKDEGVIAKAEAADLIDLANLKVTDEDVGSKASIPSAVSMESEDTHLGSPFTSNAFQFRLDAGFAKILQDTFGPVGFNLSSDSYSGSELDMSIPFELAAAIHECWSNNLCEKFQQEDTELVQMLTDEDYAKLIQAEEDAFNTGYFRKFNSDDFPVLEPKDGKQSTASNSELWSSMNNEDLALKIKRKQLYHEFPQIDRTAIDEILESNNSRYSETVNTLRLLYEPDNLSQHVIAPEYSQEYEKLLLKTFEEQKVDLAKKENHKIEKPTFADLRDDAQSLLGMRKECFEKAKSAFQSGQKEVASYYSQQGHEYTNAISTANKRASELILEITNSGRHPNTLDLHLLTTREAMKVLTEFLSRKQMEVNASNSNRNSIVLYIITGRGNHSAEGVARIKHMVDSYLKSKNYSCYQVNAGCVEVILRKTV